eukprot:TRINITY_DN135_c0_g2_i4.p1 TRINITY_DN135_c0_g2~~TRINITY_DN135_c0_g2_i4.p1  ORF type:complete len:245 (-),score=59.19 TRINITY_DN135_c0_g2_i4:296-1030(-)
MGRRKINIGYIKDDKLRKVTSCKRKKGLIKKAMELSLLCGTDILLIIRDNANHQNILYSNLPKDNKSLFDTYINDEYTHCCSNEDYGGLFDSKDVDGSEATKKPKGFKRIRADKKIKAKTKDPNNSVFQQKLKEKAPGLKISLNLNTFPIAPEINCEAQKKGLLDKKQLERIKTEDERMNQQFNNSANSMMFQVPQFGLPSAGMRDPFGSPIIPTQQLADISPFYSQLDSFSVLFQKMPGDFKG